MTSSSNTGKKYDIGMFNDLNTPPSVAEFFVDMGVEKCSRCGTDAGAVSSSLVSTSHYVLPGH